MSKSNIHLFQCSLCGGVHIFDEGAPHSRYTSLALDETEPSLAIWACSTECWQVVREKLDSGEWAMPKLTCRDYYHDVTHTQKGYKRQPDQMTLKQLYNKQRLKTGMNNV